MPGLILLRYWCLIVPFIVLGGAGVFESFGRSMRTVRGYAWRVFGTYVLVFLILIAVAIVPGFILLLLPLWLRSFVNSILSGTLIAPFLALVVTLIYYRLTEAHAGQPYTPTGPAGAPVWQPPPSTAPPAQRATPVLGLSRPAPGGHRRARPGRAAAVPGSGRATTSEPPLTADRSLPRPARVTGEALPVNP